MTRLTKITMFAYLQIAYMLFVFLPCLFIMSIHLNSILNQTLAVIYFLVFVIVFSVFSFFLLYFFSVMPLNRYKQTQKISEIPMKLSLNRSINFIELDKTSSLYYKKCLRIKTLAIHKSYTLDNNYCSALIKNNFDRMQSLFPLLFHKKQRFRFWKVRLDLIIYQGEEDVKKVKDLVAKLNSDFNYVQRRFCCVYYEKKKTIFVKQFSNNKTFFSCELSLSNYLNSLKAFCNFFGLNYYEFKRYF